jgi:NAD(P)-dependent dehydrogenase (short-subunit alcohol dehydrogenase family)
MLDESEKIALITGSAVRVGKYVTESLAKDGWKIALHYNHSEKDAYELAASLINQVDVILFKADLSNPDQAKSLIKQVNQQLGPVSLLINNASIYKNDNITNLDSSLLEQNFNIHLNSPLYLAKAMLEQDIDANIINIIDSDITKNMKKFFSYSLSKKSLLNLTQMLAFSLAPHIRVNAIAPGAILFKEGQNKELFDQFIETSPLKIKAELKDLYQTIKFLIATKSITGQCIFLDGGRHLE